MNKQINQLTPAETLEITDKLPIQTAGGVTKNVTGQQIKDLAANDYVLGWSEDRQPGNSITIGKGKGKLLLTKNSSNVTGTNGADFSNTSNFDSPAYDSTATIRLPDGTIRFISFESFPTAVEAVISVVLDVDQTEIGTEWDLETGEYEFYSYFIPIALGDVSLAEGSRTMAKGIASHSEGIGSLAFGNYSHAEGNSRALGETSHAEGNSIAAGDNSHAEGSTRAIGGSSHSEGMGSQSIGDSSHAEGVIMSKLSIHQAIGAASHIEGGNNFAYGDCGHTGGNNNVSAGLSSRATGYHTIAGATIRHNIVSHTLTEIVIAGDVSTDFDLSDHIILVDSTGEDLGNGLTRIFIPSIVGEINYNSSLNQTTININVRPSYIVHSFQKVYNMTKNTAQCASAEGNSTNASGEASHAEGQETSAKGDYSHSEGHQTNASGKSSHAEGFRAYATGDYSHAEGTETSAQGECSHTEGFRSGAQGKYSHAEGIYTTAQGEASHSEGQNTSARGNSGHSEGSYTNAEGESSHAEGSYTNAVGKYSHAEGKESTATGESAHAEGYRAGANGKASHAEGFQTIAQGDYSHAEGSQTYALEQASHAEGSNTTAQGFHSHAEGNYTTANGEASHAEGYQTITQSAYSHAEGGNTITQSEYSHAGGNSAATTMPAEWARSGGNFGKHSQYGIIDMHCNTTDSTPTLLNIGTDSQLLVHENQVYRLKVSAMAVIETTQETAEWEGLGLFKSNGTELTQVGSRMDSTFKDGGMSAVKLDMRINDTLKTIELVAEGIDGTSIYWYAKIDYIRMVI